MVEIYSKVESVHWKMSKSFKSSQPSSNIQTSKCAQTAFTMSEKIRQKDQSGKISWRLKPLKKFDAKLRNVHLRISYRKHT